MRELIKPEPAGPAALIKPKFTDEEISIYTQNVKANTLAPMHLTPRYVKERLFGAGARPGVVGIIVDGFPRDIARWMYFKDIVKEYWMPTNEAVLIVLQASKETTKKRFEQRGRAGDEFDNRFDEHERSIDTIIDGMKGDGMTVIEISSAGHGGSAEDMMGHLEGMPAWGKVVHPITP
ncbi:Diphthamide biosynthesis protein 1 [Pleosporales sp. CAS-2024a]